MNTTDHSTTGTVKSSSDRHRLMPLALALVCLGLPLKAHAVVPAPDGGYPGGNTAEGENALFSLTTGGYNTATGFYSLASDTTGSFNTAIGTATLFANDGDQNTATGFGALLSNTIGALNTANGAFALFSNTAGSQNTAAGVGALYGNTGGNYNTATGLGALHLNATGSNNTAHGINALFHNAGDNNTAVGANALNSNVLGTNNTAVGIDALSSLNGPFENGNGNTVVGYQALSNLNAGEYNIAVAGGGNLRYGAFNIYIGNDGPPPPFEEEYGRIRIGSTCCQTQAFIAGIQGAVVSGGSAVYVKSDGQLGTSTSSIRFKDEVRPMDKASEAILALRPVSFRYKKEFDPNRIPQFGLVAEEVEKVDPELVIHNAEGKPYSVRYEQVNAMLLNEFLKEHKKVQELEATVAQQQKRFADQERRTQALTSGLEKVIAHLELDKPAPQLVRNNGD